MKKTKRVAPLMLALFLVVSLFTGLAATASAANVCSFISGSNKSSVTFTVTTDKAFLGDKIVLKQSKGKAVFFTWLSKEKVADCYGNYTIIVRKISGGKDKPDYRELDWKNSGSKSISLQKNAVYKITVQPWDNTATVAWNIFRGAFDHWKTRPTWSVGKTRGVSFCK